MTSTSGLQSSYKLACAAYRKPTATCSRISICRQAVVTPVTPVTP
jgi:hypothetical protein